MEKRKRWQQLLIVGVMLLTLYNILPTVFFYSKSLKKSIEAPEASKISNEIIHRVNQLENESIDWLHSFCKLLKIKPQTVHLDKQNPQHIVINFKNVADASKFRKQLPRAGALITFVPKQLSLYEELGANSKTVTVQRKIPIHFSEAEQDQYFQFSKKFGDNQEPTPLYRALVFDRALQLAAAIGGSGENAQLTQTILASTHETDRHPLVLKLSQNLSSFIASFGENSDMAKRYFASFTQIDTEQKDELIKALLSSLEQSKDQVKLERISLQSENQTLQTKGEFLETEKQQRIEQLLKEEQIISSAEAIIKKQKASFLAGKTPWKYATLAAQLEESYQKATTDQSRIQRISFKGHNPFVHEMTIDWSTETIQLQLHADIIALKERLQAQNKLYQKDQLDRFIYNEIATFGRLTDEKVTPIGNSFQINLNQLEGSNSFLALRLSKVASAYAAEMQQMLQTQWKPKHSDLSSFSVWNYETFNSLSPLERKLGILVYAPATSSEMPQAGLRTSSIYVVAKGLDQIFQKIRENPHSEDAKEFYKDFSALKDLLQKNGFFGYPGSSLGVQDFANDFIFESTDFALPLIKATYEDFKLSGTKRYAILEFTNNEQRILLHNRVDNQRHEQLLKWRDDFHAAQLGLGAANYFDIPKPTRNLFLENVKLSIKKYFRGDDRKILHWGLDLSGGKTVQIELRDQNNRTVTGDAEIKQGIEELYSRVNKMGVSEVSIRREGNLISMDFPGSQGLSASELIKASSMSFHIVNEKFNARNPGLSQFASQFLQDVWNEAAITGRKSAEELNQIAWRHIHGDSMDPEVLQPRSEAARILYENGLRLASPLDKNSSNLFNDAVSEIAILRGEDFTKWHGQTHPLLIVFRNFALEGSHLSNIQSGYDANRGNFLLFEIKGKETLKSGEKINPRADLYAWTSQFSRDKVAGTPYAVYSANDGWRMAVTLNGTVITAPTLTFPIKDGGTIEGSFTQREVNQLEADLKAGSLTFTPRILSEKNVSPDLGVKERNFGILATIIALVLVVVAMIGYYRFGGLVASVAVIVNLLIMWATLQNLGATLTLSSIAAAILTLGMAVDANVLVFERIREELAQSGRLASAVTIGYKKAFSAIFDSNITSIIAALILLQFDSGPIKGFAVTLIIGIVSSMFTALFMTRYFFIGWVQNPKHTKLTMSQFIKATHFNFLKYSKAVFLGSMALILTGAFLFVKERHTILGMDFTGGYSLNIELEPKAQDTDYRNLVEKSLIAHGASSRDFQVRQLTPNNHLRLFLSKGMQQAGKPFYQMAVQAEKSDAQYAYETNPRINWVVESLQNQHLALTKDSLRTLEQNWNEVSGQLSDSMRNSAVIGLVIAMIAILIYITIRFEFKYAISATVCLAHDIAISLASIAILNALHLPVQIDLNTVAAILTIVGYSLNDTIIVFDRIREDIRIMRKSSFKEIINHALNVTLSRTIMTSGTTLIVLLPLAILGGSTLFAFSLVMIVGVVFGTLSSLFIAAPVLNFFHERQREKEKVTPEIVR